MPAVSRSPDPFDDAAAVSLGREPHQVNLRTVEGFYAVGCDDDDVEKVLSLLPAKSLQHCKSPAGALLVIQVPQCSDLNEWRQKVRSLAANHQVRFFTPVFCHVETELQQILTDEIAVRFKPGINSERANTILKEHELVPMRQSEFNPREYVVRTPASLGLEAIRASERLKSSEGVEYATPNFIAQMKR